jgi:hypothetical protein
LWWLPGFGKPQRELDFFNVTPHLVIACVVWWDGLVVNRVPVTWTHWYGVVVPLDCVYVAWTAIQAYFVDNPDAAATASQTHAIYSAVPWKEDWPRALVTCLVVVFGIGPVLFLLLWLCSLYSIPCICRGYRRRYEASPLEETDFV